MSKQTKPATTTHDAFVEILTELRDIGIGSCHDVNGGDAVEYLNTLRSRLRKTGARPADRVSKVDTAKRKAYHLSPMERDAALAGLRLLQTAIVIGTHGPVKDIWTNSNAHFGLSPSDIDGLVDRINY